MTVNPSYSPVSPDQAELDCTDLRPLVLCTQCVELMHVCIYLSWGMCVDPRRKHSQRAVEELRLNKLSVQTFLCSQTHSLQEIMKPVPSKAPAFPHPPYLPPSLLWDEGIQTDPIDMLRSRLTLNSSTDSLI